MSTRSRARPWFDWRTPAGGIVQRPWWECDPRWPTYGEVPLEDWGAGSDVENCDTGEPLKLVWEQGSE